MMFQFAFLQLNDFQRDIFYECIDLDCAGLSLPLGTGKTLISLCVGLYKTINTAHDSDKLMLTVTSKSLIGNWEIEIKKFFGDELKYEIIHKSMFKKSNINLWKIKHDTKLILITIDTLADFYSQYNIDKHFIKSIMINNFYINEYNRPTDPYLNHTVGGGFFYSIKWGCLIVDEYRNILISIHYGVNH